MEWNDLDAARPDRSFRAIYARDGIRVGARDDGHVRRVPGFRYEQSGRHLGMERDHMDAASRDRSRRPIWARNGLRFGARRDGFVWRIERYVGMERNRVDTTHV